LGSLTEKIVPDARDEKRRELGDEFSIQIISALRHRIAAIPIRGAISPAICRVLSRGGAHAIGNGNFTR
jgi:hypothetical protein